MKTIKIKALCSFCGAVCADAGQTLDAPQAIGEDLIAAGYAKAVGEPEKASQAPSRAAKKGAKNTSK